MKFGSESPTPITATFTFSPVNLTTLGATEYTLVSVVADRSGSVSGFAREMEKALKEIVAACRKSPRADNLLLRLTRFDNEIEEVHGFRQLAHCSTDIYDGVLEARGTTSLYDATVNGVDAAARQGAELTTNDFSANAIVFVITDGVDYRGSTATPGEVKKTIERAMKSECLESIVTVLIGVNVQDHGVAAALKSFSAEAGFSQYIEIGDASAANLAKLASFVSRSISSQSQSLGTGGPSKALTF
jgi:uncharacterized protein YegL